MTDALIKLDRRYLKWINAHFGGGGQRRRVVSFGRRLPGEERICMLSSRSLLASLNGNNHPPVLTHKVVGEMHAGTQLHVVPRSQPRGTPQSIVIRVDVDEHSNQTDGRTLRDAVVDRFFEGRAFCSTTQRGHDAIVVVEFDPYREYGDDPHTLGPVRLGRDGHPIYPSMKTINDLLDQAERALQRWAKAEGYAATIELKGRMQIVKRQIDRSDPEQVMDLEHLTYHQGDRWEAGRRYPHRIEAYGQPVRLPHVTTVEQFEQLEQARVGERCLHQIIREAPPAPALTPTPKHLTAIPHDNDGEDSYDLIDADLAMVTEEAYAYWDRRAAASRYALRKCGGDTEAAFAIALDLVLDDNGGPTTGPKHAERVRTQWASIQHYANSYDPSQTRKAGGWFDATVISDMLKRQTGMVSERELAAINTSRRHAKLTRRKLAAITLMINKTVVTGNFTHVTSEGLLRFAKDPRVGVPGINTSTIAAAKELLLATGQIVCVAKHSTWHGACARFKLGARAIIQPWLRPLLIKGVQVDAKSEARVCTRITDGGRVPVLLRLTEYVIELKGG